MYGLIKPLYNEERQRVIESLYENSDSHTQLLIRASIAEALKDCPRLIESHGCDWILCTLASFHKSEDDTMRVYQAIMSQFDKFSIGIMDDKIKLREMNEIADSCLVGLSFFREYIEAKHRRKGLPSPDYYKKVGSIAFQRLGFDSIGAEFDSWISFIEKEMIV